MAERLPGDSATRTTTSRPPRAAVMYALARTYYEVELVSTDTDLKLKVRGPLFEADLDHMHQLDMRHSAFASDRFEIDRDENNMLEFVTMQSRGRANAIAYGIGASVGAAFGASSEAPEPHVEGDREVTARAPAVLLTGRWYPGQDGPVAPSTTSLEARLNAVITSWFREACGRRGSCAPLGAPTVSLASALAEARTAQPAVDCRLVICYSAQARASLQIEITPPTSATPRRQTRVENADLGASRSISIVDPAVTSSHYEYIDPRMGSAGGGSLQLVFQRGTLSYVSFGRRSEAESIVLLPYDVVRGAANTIYSVLPVRIAIEYQRRQLDIIQHAATPAAPTAATATAVAAISDAEAAPPDAMQAPAAHIIETRVPEVREFIIAQRAGPAGSARVTTTTTTTGTNGGTGTPGATGATTLPNPTP